MNTKCEYIFRMRKEITTNFKKLTSAMNITKFGKIT